MSTEQAKIHESNLAKIREGTLAKYENFKAFIVSKAPSSHLLSLFLSCSMDQFIGLIRAQTNAEPRDLLLAVLSYAGLCEEDFKQQDVVRAVSYLEYFQWYERNTRPNIEKHVVDH